MSKKQKIEELRELLRTRQKWAQRGLLRIYTFQTENEQSLQATVEQNGVGFTGTDANILSSMAQQLKARGFLTEGQMKVVFKLMPKYAGQLYRYVEQTQGQHDEHCTDLCDPVSNRAAGGGRDSGAVPARGSA